MVWDSALTVTAVVWVYLMLVITDWKPLLVQVRVVMANPGMKLDGMGRGVEIYVLGSVGTVVTETTFVT